MSVEVKRLLQVVFAAAVLALTTGLVQGCGDLSGPTTESDTTQGPGGGSPGSRVPVTDTLLTGGG